MLEGGVAAIIFEFGGHTRTEYTALAHPVWNPPGNMWLAFADSSFLGCWVSFL